MRCAAVFLLFALPLFARSQSNEGPDAPDATITYASGTGFTFAMSNPLGSNNVLEQYQEAILPPEVSPDPVWRFQGYAIMQFATPADADDSLQLVFKDLARARPVLLLDVDDTIDVVTHHMIQAGDSCQAVTWMMINTGTGSVYSAFMDPFTFAPYEEDSTYCFLVLAFATNPFHEDDDCGGLQQVIFSSGSASGPLVAHCVSPATMGVGEHGLTEVVLGPQPADHRLNFVVPGTFGMRCVDGRGRVVRAKASCPAAVRWMSVIWPAAHTPCS